MTNLDRVVAVLETHREARRWTDEAVARDVLAQLGLEPDGEVKSLFVASVRDVEDTAPEPAQETHDRIAPPGPLTSSDLDHPAQA